MSEKSFSNYIKQKPEKRTSMILFINDWEKYPSAIVHTQTKNQSFLDMAGVYKSMGIKNHAFLLALHNPLLAEIDPHDPTLTDSMKRMVMKEAYENPWYYFRECVKAPPLAGIDPIQFRANRGNMATLWLFFNHIMQLLIQPRQTGKSFTVDSLMAGLLNLWCFNTKINLLTKDEKLRAETVSRLKDIIKYLPKYMVMRTKKDSNNSESISIQLNNNVYKSHVAQSSEAAAFNAARGLSSPIMHIDEFAYYKHIGTALPAALPATGAAMEVARANNAPHGVIFTTTAGWLDSASGAYAHEFYEESAIWYEEYLDSRNIKALKKVIRKNSSSNDVAVVVDMNHRQLGFTDIWLQERIRSSKAKGAKAETDFLNIWADGSNESPFDKDILAKLKAGISHKVLQQITSSGYVLRWYTPRTTLKNVKLVMGMDTSDAVGKDDIALTIRRVDNGEVVAVGQFNETNTITFAKWISELLIGYPQMILMIERRSTGVSIIDYVINFLTAMDINPFTRLFNWVVQEKGVHPERYDDCMKNGLNPSVQDLHRRQFGFATSSNGRASRDKVYGDALLQSVKFTYNKVYDKRLIGQISGMTTRNGRIDHKSGSKDDLVMSWMLAYWFLTKGNNVEAYGFSQSELLARMEYNEAKDDKDETAITLAKIRREKINALLNRLESAEDEFLINSLIVAIERLSKELKDEEALFNISQTVKKVKLLNKDKKSKKNHKPKANFGLLV